MTAWVCHLWALHSAGCWTCLICQHKCPPTRECDSCQHAVLLLTVQLAGDIHNSSRISQWCTAQAETEILLFPANAASSAALPRQLPLHDYTTQAITGHQSPITCLATHPTQPLTFTADQGGLTMLWHSGPLTPLGSLGGLLGDSLAAGSTPQVSAACWLVTQAAAKDVGGILAVGTASQFVLIEVTMK